MLISSGYRPINLLNKKNMISLTLCIKHIQSQLAAFQNRRTEMDCLLRSCDEFTDDRWQEHRPFHYQWQECRIDRIKLRDNLCLTSLKVIGHTTSGVSKSVIFAFLSLINSS